MFHLKRQRRSPGGIAAGAVTHDRWPTVLAMALLVTFIACRGSIHLSQPEFAMLDQWFRMRPPRAISPEIVLIGIEDSERIKLEKKQAAERRPGRPGCNCMLMQRDDLAEGIRLIKQAGAAVVGVDLVFELPCPVSGHDAALHQALEMQPGYTVITSATYPEPGKFIFRQMPEFLELSHVIVASPVLYNPRGSVRGVRLVQRDEPVKETVAPGVEHVLSNTRPPFALACYNAYRGRPDELPEDLSPTLVRCADSTIPVLMSESVCLLGPLMTRGDRHETSAHAMLINWAGRAGTFPAYSFDTLITSTAAARHRVLAGKIVLIGAMADRQRTPMQDSYLSLPMPPPQAASALFIDQSRETDLTGLEVHANALNTVLQHRYITPPQYGLMWGLIFGLGGLALTAFRRRAAWQAVILAGAAILGVFILARLLMNADYWLFAVTPAAAVILSAGTGAVMAYGEARYEAGQLAKSLDARDSLTATLVHDLKQPLTAINALAQVLRAEDLRGGGRLTPEVIERIQKQVQTALGDIDELLSTDPNRTLLLDKKRFDLAALARDLAVTQSMKTGIHTVEVHAPEEGVWVTADARYLGRALSNLMDNAIKYWPSGGTVVVEIRDEPGRVSTRVVDHGMGVPKEAQARLFNRFERAVPDGVNIPGTGIGLFSVRRIMEAHGGTVELISAPGEGSIFILNLPHEAAHTRPEGLRV